jgi:hypothetical protein
MIGRAWQFSVAPPAPLRQIGARMDEKEFAEFVARLPAHLRFFFDPLPKELEDEEVLQFMRERVARVRELRDEFIAHGVAADRFIAESEPKIAGLELANQEVDRLEDALLNARADLADAQYKLFRASEQALRRMEEEKPFDPQVQELREEIDEWAKHFPKE